MHLAERLYQLALQRSALVAGALHPPLEAALATTEQRLQLLEAALKQAEVKSAETHRQQHEGEATRGKLYLYLAKGIIHYLLPTCSCPWPENARDPGGLMMKCNYGCNGSHQLYILSTNRHL